MTAPQKSSLKSPAPRATAGALPHLEIHFTPIPAWLMIGFGGIFLILAIVLMVLPRAHGVGFGIVLATLSVAAMVGGNIWRNHLPIVARLTNKQLILKRGGSVAWNEIAVIEKKTIRMRYKANRGESDWICIKLKTSRPVEKGLNGFFLKLKNAVTGYDIIVPQQDLSISADAFIEECKKRMAAASGTM
jgi:hypothetical protein